MRKILLLLLIPLFFGPSVSYAVDRTVVFYVSPTGSDMNPGTAGAPFRTLGKAIEGVRDSRGKNDGKRYIFLRGGVHEITAPVDLGPREGGAEDFTLTIKPSAGERATLSGGRKLTGWQLESKGLAVIDLNAMHEAQCAEITARNTQKKAPWDAEQNRLNLIYTARKQPYTLKPFPEEPLPEKIEWNFRDIYISNDRAVRARTPNEGFFQIEATEIPDQFRLVEGELPELANPETLEIVLAAENSYKRIPVISYEPETRLLRLLPETVAASPGTNFPAYFENAREFLDAEGEWFLDHAAQKLYYRLRGREIPKELVAFAPIHPYLLSLKGTWDDGDQTPVQNIRFEGVKFAHTLAELPVTGEEKPSPVLTAVRLKDVENCVFSECTFEALGGNALVIESGCMDIVLEKTKIRATGGMPLFFTDDIGKPEEDVLELITVEFENTREPMMENFRLPPPPEPEEPAVEEGGEGEPENAEE